MRVLRPHFGGLRCSGKNCIPAEEGTVPSPLHLGNPGQRRTARRQAWENPCKPDYTSATLGSRANGFVRRHDARDWFHTLRVFRVGCRFGVVAAGGETPRAFAASMASNASAGAASLTV